MSTSNLGDFLEVLAIHETSPAVLEAALGFAEALHRADAIAFIHETLTEIDAAYQRGRWHATTEVIGDAHKAMAYRSSLELRLGMIQRGEPVPLP